MACRWCRIICTLDRSASHAAAPEIVTINRHLIHFKSLTIPSALYANAFNTLFLDNVNDGEAFGFSKHQVTPFNIRTPDGETLYAWHILPTDVYARNEKDIRDENRPHDRPVDDFTKTVPFALLTSNDPTPSRVLVSCMSTPVDSQDFR